MRYDPEKKIAELRKRGWSEKKIEAHMRARNFDMSTKTSRKRNEQEQRSRND